jgi:hypothetical protein
MTIGIGVVATSEAGRANKVLPDTAILIADTMGSYGDVDSHARLHKAFMFPDARVYAVAADRVDRASELLFSFAKVVKEIPDEERTYGAIVRTLAMVCYGYKRDKFTTHEFPKLRLPPREMDPTTATPKFREIVQAQWENFSIGCDLIVATFCGDGTVCFLKVIGSEHEIANMLFPGFSAIGAGSELASFWLSRREQALGQLPLRAGYHAYEAKRMAEGSPHVNKHLDIIVATKKEHWFCMSHPSNQGEIEHPEINIKNLRRLWKRYSPRDTAKLGKACGLTNDQPGPTLGRAMLER